ARQTSLHILPKHRSHRPLFVLRIRVVVVVVGVVVLVTLIFHAFDFCGFVALALRIFRIELIVLPRDRAAPAGEQPAFIGFQQGGPTVFARIAIFGAVGAGAAVIEVAVVVPGDVDAVAAGALD